MEDVSKKARSRVSQARMKTLLKGLSATFLLIASSSSSFAEEIETQVTAEQARELGVVIKSRKHGDDRTWISLELNTDGEWERFGRVDLVVKSGDAHLVTAPLAVTRPSPESISVGFFAHSSTLADSELQVCVDSRGSMVYRFKLRDFVEVEEISAKKAQKESTKAEQDGADQPATAPESKPEGDSKPKPDSEGRSQ